MKRLTVSLAAALMMVLMCFALAGQAKAEGNAPTGENLEFVTKRGIPIEGTLSACDPEDDVLSFVITTKPVRGDLILGNDGHFIYTPRKNKRGRDYFGYRAVDAAGNVSQEATVLIRIEK